jgi:small subunit ribosomal protein S6
MRFYETIFIIKPDLSEEVLSEREQWAKDILTNNGAQIVNVEQWGKKRLAYQLSKQRYGHYILMQYESEPEVVPELERNLRMSEEVLKYITVRLAGKQMEKAKVAAAKAAEEAVRREEARAAQEAEKAAEQEAAPEPESTEEEDTETTSEDEKEEPAASAQEE